MATINTICHAIKIIIRLTETLRTSLLTLPNSIYIIGGIGRISKTQFKVFILKSILSETYAISKQISPKRRLQRCSLLKSDQTKSAISVSIPYTLKQKLSYLQINIFQNTKWQHQTINNFFSTLRQQLN